MVAGGGTGQEAEWRGDQAFWGEPFRHVTVIWGDETGDQYGVRLESDSALVFLLNSRDPGCLPSAWHSSSLLVFPDGLKL